MNATEIKNLAYLSRIKVTDSDIEKFQDLNDVVEMIDKINNIDTHKIEPMSHPLDIPQRLRNDVVTEGNIREEIQAIAPGNIEAGLYLIPEVFEE